MILNTIVIPMKVPILGQHYKGLNSELRKEDLIGEKKEHKRKIKDWIQVILVKTHQTLLSCSTYKNKEMSKKVLDSRLTQNSYQLIPRQNLQNQVF